jgi:hypothetical protein
VEESIALWDTIGVLGIVTNGFTGLSVTSDLLTVLAQCHTLANRRVRRRQRRFGGGVVANVSSSNTVNEITAQLGAVGFFEETTDLVTVGRLDSKVDATHTD